MSSKVSSTGGEILTTLPNFLIIGASKCGTTAMYKALRVHPQIFMSPVKEPKFFTFCNTPNRFTGPGSERYNQKIISAFDQYQDLFANVTDEIAIGEASPIYMSCRWPQQTARTIQEIIPHARLIAILRNPADRAFSAYLFRRQLGDETIGDFWKAIEKSQLPERENWLSYHYLKNGFYFANLKPYFDIFPRNQIRIYIYEDWSSQPETVLQDIFEFLGVAPSVLPQMIQRVNETYTFKNSYLHNFLIKPNSVKNWMKTILPDKLRATIVSKLIQLNRSPKPSLDTQNRQKLIEIYRQDILHLQNLIQRDLMHWLQVDYYS